MRPVLGLSRSMPLKINSTTALVFSAVMELHTTTHHFLWMVCRKHRRPGRRWTSLLFMYVGGQSYFASSGLQ
jgi:hypothetical protein